MFIFLDESGQFAKHDHEKYFIVGSFTVGEYRRTEKKFRGWQRSKFPKKSKHQPEIKFSNVNISDELKIRTLKYISELDVRIRYVYLKKQNIPEEYFYKKFLKSGHLYTQIIGEALEKYLPPVDPEFRVFCDQRHLKGMKRSEFKQELKTRLLPLLPAKSCIQIEMLDSEKNPNIQIADWIAGALAHYLEKKPIGEKYYEILKNNIIGEGEELFKNYWSEKFKNKKPNHYD